MEPEVQLQQTTLVVSRKLKPALEDGPPLDQRFLERLERIEAPRFSLAPIPVASEEQNPEILAPPGHLVHYCALLVSVSSLALAHLRHSLVSMAMVPQLSPQLIPPQICCFPSKFHLS